MVTRMAEGRYEIMLQLSRQLADEHIDDEMSEVQLGGPNNHRTITNRTVRVRGLLGGRGLVVSVQDYYFPGDGLRYVPPVPNILEVFVAGNHLTFEGECRTRTFLDTIGRWLGGGGLRGPHPIFDRRRVDAHRRSPAGDFERAEFCARLESVSGHPDCLKVQIQAGAGVNALFRAGAIMRHFARLDAVVRDCAALAAA